MLYMYVDSWVEKNPGVMTYLEDIMPYKGVRVRVWVITRLLSLLVDICLFFVCFECLYCSSFYGQYRD